MLGDQGGVIYQSTLLINVRVADKPTGANGNMEFFKTGLVWLTKNEKTPIRVIPVTLLCLFHFVNFHLVNVKISTSARKRSF